MSYPTFRRKIRVKIQTVLMRGLKVSFSPVRNLLVKIITTVALFLSKVQSIKYLYIYNQW